MTPEGFPKLFAVAFGRHDSTAMAGWLAEDAQVLTLTGAVAEDAKAAELAFKAEFSGTFAMARLVTGKQRLRQIGPGGAILHQRFVVTGARDDHGQDLPRFGAMLTVVMLARAEGWRAESLTFSALAQ